jgi:hypothetical protein
MALRVHKIQIAFKYCIGWDSFCSLVNVPLLRYCTYRCNGQKYFVMYFFERWRIDLQISIFVFSHELLVFRICQICQIYSLKLVQKTFQFFLYAYTPSYISDTRGPNPKWKNYLLPGFISKLAEILTQVVKIVGQK